MVHRCTGCSRHVSVIQTFSCDWRDGLITVERYCLRCVAVWKPEMEKLGAVFTEVVHPDSRIAGVS